MAWTKTTVHRNDGYYLVATETLTVASSDLAGQDLTSSEIDFIPPGKDFVIISNYDSTDLSSEADVAVKVGYETGGTFVTLKDDLIQSIDATVKAALYDISSYGEAPYYKIFIDSDGVQKKNDTVDIIVVVPIE